MKGNNMIDENQISTDEETYEKTSLNDFHRIRNAIKFVEDKYPKTTAEFKRLQKEQYKVFCEKQMDYGPGNISVGTNLETDEEVKMSLTGLWFRMNDKIQRMKTLLMSNQEANNEPLEDSFLDVSNYGIMSTIVSNKKWGK
tara:strand:- start:174 stop:596 length:423 start_codon:yes stop_codon:yes gene_type:complete